MLKTNKSFAKRLKVSKNGKISRRGIGHCHFNAKESGRSQMGKSGYKPFTMSHKEKSLYLVNI